MSKREPRPPRQCARHDPRRVLSADVVQLPLAQEPTDVIFAVTAQLRGLADRDRLLCAILYDLLEISEHFVA
jgi:hypothetical protein